MAKMTAVMTTGQGMRPMTGSCTMNPVPMARNASSLWSFWTAASVKVYARPRMIENMASVTMNELMPSPSVRPALTSPTMTPMATATTSPIARLEVALSACIATTPTKACIDPTERSTSRPMISSVIPIAVIIVIDIWLSRTKMFRSEAKTGESRERTTQSATRTRSRMPSWVRNSQVHDAGQRPRAGALAVDRCADPDGGDAIHSHQPLALTVLLTSCRWVMSW